MLLESEADLFICQKLKEQRARLSLPREKVLAEDEKEGRVFPTMVDQGE